MTAPTVAVVSPEALRQIIVEAVQEALAELAPAQPEGLLDRAELARRLGLSTRALDRLRREGLPTIMVGDVPRWRWPAVVEWLEGRVTP